MKTVMLFASLPLLVLLGCTNNEEPTAPPPSETSRAVEPTSPSTSPPETSQSMESSPASPTAPQTAQPGETPTMGDTTASVDDQELKERIQSALEVDPSLSDVAETVQIETTDGKVTLRGSAPSAQEKEQIATKVQQMEGVQEVDNQLQVASR